MSFGLPNPALQHHANRELQRVRNEATGGNLVGGRSATGSSKYGGLGKVELQDLGKYRHFTSPSFTPQMMQHFEELFQHLGPDSFLAKLMQGDPELFQQLEAPAMRQFSEMQGNIASRFGGSGALGGGRKSSGFQNIQNQAASDFAQQLQGQRLGLQRQAYSDLFDYSNKLLQQRPYERYVAPKTPSTLTQFGMEGFKGLMKALPAMIPT